MKLKNTKIIQYWSHENRFNLLSMNYEDGRKKEGRWHKIIRLYLVPFMRDILLFQAEDGVVIFILFL
jgi:hypothetical protein